jgi:hypothetical protein
MRPRPRPVQDPGISALYRELTLKIRGRCGGHFQGNAGRTLRDGYLYSLDNRTNSWIDEVARLIEEFHHLLLGHPHLLAVECVFDAVD